MGHVHHKARAHAVGDGGHALKVDDARVRRGARDDQRGALRTGGEALDRLVVDDLGLKVKAVGHKAVQLAREVDRAADA